MTNRTLTVLLTLDENAYRGQLEHLATDIHAAIVSHGIVAGAYVSVIEGDVTHCSGNGWNGQSGVLIAAQREHKALCLD